MNKNKAAGPDGFVIKMLAALDDFDIETITEKKNNEIYKHGDIPKDLKRSIFIELPYYPSYNLHLRLPLTFT